MQQSKVLAWSARALFADDDGLAADEFSSKLYQNLTDWLARLQSNMHFMTGGGFPSMFYLPLFPPGGHIVFPLPPFPPTVIKPVLCLFVVFFSEWKIRSNLSNSNCIEGRRYSLANALFKRYFSSSAPVVLGVDWCLSCLHLARVPPGEWWNQHQQQQQESK